MIYLTFVKGRARPFRSDDEPLIIGSVITQKPKQILSKILWHTIIFGELWTSLGKELVKEVEGTLVCLGVSVGQVVVQSKVDGLSGKVAVGKVVEEILAAPVFVSGPRGDGVSDDYRFVGFFVFVDKVLERQTGSSVDVVFFR